MLTVCSFSNAQGFGEGSESSINATRPVQITQAVTEQPPQFKWMNTRCGGSVTRASEVSTGDPPSRRSSALTARPKGDMNAY